MRQQKTNCPRCESEQAFPRLRRQTTLSLANVQEVYIRCTLCHWEKLLSYTTKEIEGLDRKLHKARERGMTEQRMKAKMSISTHRMIMRLSLQRVNAERHLQTRIGAAGGG